jgi:transcriptional regulator with XRE-family HTH domain
MPEMDQKKVGMFIAETRKAKGLTQKDLAERLALSDKTISKWETAKSMPDPSLMIPLCEVLEINVNELLSGERLDTSEYSRKAEENMIHLMKEKNQEGKNRRKEFWLTVIGELLLVVLMILVLIIFGDFFMFQHIFDIGALGAMFAVDVVLLLMTGLIKDFGRAVKCLFKGTEDRSCEQLARALRAVRMVSVASVAMGALTAVIAVLFMLYNMVGLSSVGPALSHALLSLGYGFVAVLLLLPVRMKLELGLMEQETLHFTV